MPSVRPFEEPLTVVQISESVTKRLDQVVDNEKNENKIVVFKNKCHSKNICIFSKNTLTFYF